MPYDQHFFIDYKAELRLLAVLQLSLTFIILSMKSLATFWILQWQLDGGIAVCSLKARKSLIGSVKIWK